MAAQLFGDRLDLARRNALDIHLGQRRHQRLLRPLVALEQLGRQAPGTVLRHPPLPLADPRPPPARVRPRTVPEARLPSPHLCSPPPPPNTPSQQHPPPNP